MSFYAQYPASSGGSANASVGVNGTTAPTSSTEIGAINSSTGNLQPLSTDAAGNLNVNIQNEAGAPFHVIVDSSALPTGASTSANQASEISLLNTIEANQTNGMQMVQVSSLPLPPGAATSALQTNGNTSLSTILAQQTNGTQITQISGSIPLPTGAATAGLQSNVQGPATGGTSASTAELVAGAYTGASGALSLTTGQQAALQLDANANLRTVGIGTAGTPLGGVFSVQGVSGGTPIPVSGSITASNPSVSTVATTPPTSATYIGGSVTTAAPTYTTAQINALSLNTSGGLRVDGSGVTQPISATSLPLPTGAATSANQVTANTPIGAAGAGTAGSNSFLTGGVYNVTLPSLSTGQQTATQLDSSGRLLIGSIAASALPTGAATSANQATEISSLATIVTNTTNITVAQGSTTSGQTGQLVQGAVTTAAPTYTTGQTNPLSLTTSGALRVDTSGSSVPTGGSTAALQSSTQGSVSPGTAAINSTLAGMVYNSAVPAPTNGQQLALQSDQFGNLEISEPDQYITGAAAQTATVNNILPSTSGTAANDVSNYKAASVQVVSTGTAGTFIFEGSNDNVNFQTVPVYNQNIVNGTVINGAITATASQFIYTLPLHFRYFRLRIATTITGGSIQAFTRLTQATWAPSNFEVSQATAASLQTTATIASGTVTTVSTVSSVTSSQSAIPGLIADVASAAITTTTTTATITPTFGSSYLVDIPVTAVSGTTPTLSVAVQESADSGTNWYTVYTFPTITAIGSYNSPVLTLTGNRVRYVQTLTGTTPSFTRAINRLQSSQAGYTVPTGTIYTDRSGTTSGTASTSTQVAAANQVRRYFIIQNLSSTATVYINFTSAAATTGSIALLPFGSYTMESSTLTTEAINILSTTASVPYAAKEG